MRRTMLFQSAPARVVFVVSHLAFALALAGCGAVKSDGGDTSGGLLADGGKADAPATGADAAADAATDTAPGADAAPWAQCTSASECPMVGAPCQLCSGVGGYSCPDAVCVAGQCSIQWSPCSGPDPVDAGPGPSCSSDAQCAAPAICQLCDDGTTTSCANAHCIYGTCQVSYEPPCPIVVDAGAGGCASDSDCPAIKAPCQACTDGVHFSCPASLCVAAQCEVVWSPCP